MDETRAFLVLGIAECKEEQAIRQAYREKLRFVNPEDDPEGFKELRTAYETALEYVRTKEETKEEDDSLEGQWESRLNQLYTCFSDRLNLEKWKELMEEEICISLDSGEECRKRLINFLMDHFRLPTQVWRYLDRIWGFTERKSELYEEYPGDFVDFLLTVCRDGSWFPLDAFTGPDDGDYDLYINLYFELDNVLTEGNTERAETLMSQMQGLGLSHPYGDLDFARILLPKEPEQARKLTEAACEALPEDGRVLYISGLVFWDLGEKEKAASQFLGLLRENPNNFTANKMLGKYWLEKGDLNKAKEFAIEAVDGGSLEGSRDPEVLEMLNTINEQLISRYQEIMEKEPDNFKNRLELGWCYLQNDRLHDALSLLANVQPDKANAEEYHNLMGKLYFNNQQNDRSMEQILLWREYLEKREESWKKTDPDEEERKKNTRRLITANGLLGRLYRIKGKNGKTENFEKALECINKTMELGSKDPAYWMEKADIYKTRGIQTSSEADYEEAINVLTELLKDEPGYFPAYVVRQECYALLRDAGGVIDNYYQAKNIYAGFAPVYIAAAEVYNDLERWSDLEELLEEAQKNGAYTIPLKIYKCRMDREKAKEKKELEQILEDMRQLKSEINKQKKASSDPEEWEFTIKDEAKLEAEICITLSLLGNPQNALNSIKRAQKLDKTESRYKWIEGNLLRRQNKYEEALSAYEACRKDYDHSGLFHYYIGECYEGMGKRLLAIASLKKALELEPDHPEYLRKMADLYQVLLEDTGKVRYFEEGIVYADRRIALEPTTYDYVNRGLMYMTTNHLEEALRDFLKAGEMEENNQFAWANVACAYKKMGQYDKALHYIKKAISMMESEPSTYFYETLGGIYMRMGDYENALKAYLENLKRYPKRYAVAQSVSDAYEKLGRYQDALDMWRKFFPADQDAEYYDEAVGLLLSMKDFKKAEEAIEKGTPSSGKGKAAVRQAAAAMHQKKKLFLGAAMEKAVKTYEETDSGNYRSACRMAALYFWMKGKRDKARKYTELYWESFHKAFGSVSMETAEGDCTSTRMRLYDMVLLSLLKGENEKAEAFCRELSEHPWCSQCDDCVCREELTAKAFLAWTKGKKEEALELAQQVIKGAPLFTSACVLITVIKGV